MSASQIFLVIVSGLGVIHGLFLAIFLKIYPRGNPTSNKILSLLLIVLSFRVGKSVFLEFAEGLDVKLIFIGLGTLMAIGPLFYLYAQSCSIKHFRLRRTHLIHFIPTVVGVAFGFWVMDTHLQTLPKLFFLFLFLSYYGHYLVYLLAGRSFISKQRKAGLNDDAYYLLQLLFFGLMVIWVAYVLNLFDDLIPYVVGPVLYSIVAYVISFIVIQKGYIQKIDQSKYKTTPVSDEQIDRLFHKVERMVIDDKVYRKSDLTLKSLSDELNVTTQVLSLVINQKSNTNFNSFINKYRIEESIRLFDDDNYKNLTVSAIAYEVGFNSISSFNSAFKKHTGKTPQTYRQDVMK